MNIRTNSLKLILLAGLGASPALAATVPFSQTLTGTGSGVTVTDARQMALNSLADQRVEFRAACRFSGGTEGFDSNTPESGTAASYQITQGAACSALPPVQRATPYSDVLSAQNSSRDAALASIASQQQTFADTCIGTNRGVTVYSVLQESVNNGVYSFSVTGNCNPPNTASPAAPSRIFVIPKNGAIEMSWDPVPGATAYNLYYKTDNSVSVGNGTQVNAAAAPTTISGLTNGANYFFVLTSLGSSGESSGSLVIGPVTPSAAVVAPLSIPAVPSFIHATAGDGQITIAWNASSFATSYNVYMGTQRGLTIQNGIKSTTSSTSLTVLGLQNGQNYFFLVTAVSPVGESNPSSLIGPEIPIAGGSTTTTLPYTILISTTGTDRNAALATLNSLAQAASAKCSNTDHGVPRLGTVTELQTSPFIEQQALTCDTPANPATIAPAPPVSISVKSTGPGSVQLSWKPVASATSYNVYYGTDPNLVGASKISVATNSASISGLNDGKTYYFAVSSVNGAGEGARSRAVTAVTSLNGVSVHPNPWRPDRGYPNFIQFDNLTDGASLKIFTVSGRYVKSPSVNGTTAQWDLTNDAGQNVASGIYFYVITNSGDQRLRGQVTVIR